MVLLSLVMYYLCVNSFNSSYLKLLRQARALTQQQLADRAGVNRSTIARLEAGVDVPFPTTVRKLGAALGLQPGELFEARQERSSPLAVSDVAVPVWRTSGSLPRVASLGEGAAGAAWQGLVEGASRPEVERMLQEHSGLALVVEAAAGAIVRFIPDARLRLQLLEDPDFGEAPQLFLGVFTELPEREALAGLQRFDEDWWVRNAYRARGLLCIDLSDE